MKTEIHTVQDLMNSKMGQLDRKNKHQVPCTDTYFIFMFGFELLMYDSLQNAWRIEASVR